jgi:hypothetical protein
MNSFPNDVLHNSYFLSLLYYKWSDFVNIMGLEPNDFPLCEVYYDVLMLFFSLYFQVLTLISGG